MTEYWLAQIGRNRTARLFNAFATLGAGLGYYGYHTIFNDLVKNFYSHRNEMGEKDTINSDLRKLIAKVYIEAREKQKLGREFLEFKQSKPPSITWFASSTLVPINLGMTEFRTGVIIGVPYYYNYESIDDIPDSLLKIQKLKLFRNPFKSKGTKTDPHDKEAEQIASATENVRPEEPKLKTVREFKRDSESGRAFMDTLILSENAKKFSIARELFLCDSYRVLSNSFVVVACCVLGQFGGRFSVKYWSLMTKSISVRLPYYIFSFLYAGLLLNITLSMNNNHYRVKARDRAKALGDDYAKGADEYFSKIKKRRELFSTLEDEDY